MSQLYVVGGRSRPGLGEDTKEWHQYGTAVIVTLDTDSREVQAVVEYVTPADRCADDDPSIVFKTGTLVDSRLYVPTQTEVLIYDVPSFEQVGYVSLPCFNDVHHVRPSRDGNLLIANTGLDMVLEVTPEGAVVREWGVIDEPLWTRFSRDVDYRKVVTTKPHRSHPNNVWMLNGDVWVTRCDQMDALCLTEERPTIPIADRWIHDGVLHGDFIYFTSVNGWVIEVDAHTREVRRRIDLNELARKGPPLGWCRGLEMLDDDLAVVGFSRLRPTKWKSRVAWAKNRLAGGSGDGLCPTSVGIFDLRRGEFCSLIDLELAGMHVVFSIHKT